MDESTGFRTSEMNWHATDLPDKVSKFKQYCNLKFSCSFAKKTEKEQVSFILLWIGRQGSRPTTAGRGMTIPKARSLAKFGSGSKDI